MLNLAYDKQFDILYARLPFTGHSYVEEDSNFATYHNIETDSVTGVAIYSFKKKFENGSLSAIRVPIPIDFNSKKIRCRHIRLLTADTDHRTALASGRFLTLITKHFLVHCSLLLSHLSCLI